MDAKYYNLPDRPYFNKISLYPEGYAPEAYIYSYALKFASEDKAIMQLGCGWNEKYEMLVEGYGKFYSVDESGDVLDSFKNHTHGIANLSCSILSNDRLPFYDDFFDVIMSPRGILLDRYAIFDDCVRVLKNSGHLIATITGESDLLELKKTFARGYNFFNGDYAEEITTKLDGFNHHSGGKLKTLVLRELRYKEYYQDLESFVKLLGTFSIIPNFSFLNRQDRESALRYAEEHETADGIEIERHVLFWAAQKIKD
jgi:SAM-dependent methyltransferase